MRVEFSRTRHVSVFAFALLVLIFFMCRVDCFVPRGSGRKRPATKILVASKSTSASSVDPASRFHSDMRRVLESRRNLSSSSKIVWEPLDRRKRPELLTTDMDGAERVLTMLQHMVSIGVATEESYRIVLEALVQRGRLRWRREDSMLVCAADEVHMIMHELWGLVGEGQMSTETCNLALQAYAVCATPRGNRQYANYAQSLLEKMIENGIEVDAESIGHVIHAWSWQQENLRSGECAQMAQENFDRLWAYSPDVETLQRSYHWLLEAWSKSSDEGSKERAEAILKEMISLRKKHPESDFPNSNSFSNAILAFSKDRVEESASKAQELLDMAISYFERGEFPEDTSPDLIAFNGVLSAWARLGRPDKAEAVLSKLVRLSEKYPKVAPDTVSYNNVLYANLQGSNKVDFLARILTIVQLMEENAEEHPTLKPDSFTYSVVMKAWLRSKRPDAAYKALDAVRKMHALWASGDTVADPSNRYYNMVINALAKNKNGVDPREAYDLLLQMQASKDCKPDVITYTSVIECFSKSTDLNAPRTSVELLRQAEADYKRTNNPKMMPNMRTYSMAILAANTNPTLENVLQARELLVELLSLYDETGNPDLEPNAFPFNYALNCAANCIGTSEEKVKAFQAAAQTYNDLRKRDSVLPDSYTYGFWFKCCNNLLPDCEIRTKGLTLSFEQCKADGLVSSENLRRLLARTPPDLVRSILDLGPKTLHDYRQLTLEDLPPDWSRNVR